MTVGAKARRGAAWWRWLGLALLYGAGMAVVTFLLALVDARYRMMLWSPSFTILLVAIGFAALGIWVGNRLTARPALPFAVNHAAIATLGLSARELDVLDQLVAGHANKVIARNLGISPNTVKTHVARLFEKLEAANRTQAVARARALRIIA